MHANTQFIQSDFRMDGKQEHTGEEDTEGEVEEERPIRWVNIIFLPYQSWWQWLIIFIVFLKAFFAPLNSISDTGIQCSSYDFWQNSAFMYQMYYIYNTFTPLYLVDTFFYIVHRQVADEAMKREYEPKPGILIIFDIISMIPLFQIFADKLCMPVTLWPHILNFNELLVIYRIWNFFSLNQSHNYIQLICGYTLLFILIANGLTCFLVMWTHHGLCPTCRTTDYSHMYDWRAFQDKMFAEYNFNTFIHYFYGMAFVLYQFLNKFLDPNKPSTYISIGISIVLSLLGYLLILFLLMPKFFGEGLLRSKSLCRFHPRVKRIIEETERRNPSPDAARKVESFYSLLWRKGNGISSMPNKLWDLPRYMRIDIKQDLAWAIFYHSPTFRKTTNVYRRWLCQHVQLTYKQPGERFFSGPHCYSYLYYLKSGIVQLISMDDSTSPVLSLTSGTIFGDINFYVPARNRVVIARCLTYCEVFRISRGNILMSLHKFPDDRRVILKAANDRLKHAHELYLNKGGQTGDRTEDEGFFWLKRRWWEVSSALNHWKMNLSKYKKKCEVPPEEQNYHCAKFIGQLVLCSDIKLQRKSLFTKVDFPCVFAQYASFVVFWNKMIRVVVILVLLIHPPCVLMNMIFEMLWFQYFSFFVDVLFVTDTLVTISTSLDGGDTDQSYLSVLFQRCRRLNFLLDVLATPLSESLLRHLVADSPVCLYNRLIKTYLLFRNKDKPVWDRHWNLTVHTFYRIVVTAFVFTYIPSFLVYVAVKYTWISPSCEEFLFRFVCLNGTIVGGCDRFLNTYFGSLTIFIQWTSFVIIGHRRAKKLPDIAVGVILVIFYKILNIYLSQKFISTLYMQWREMVNYQYFVTNIREHYNRLKIHPALMIRMNRYLNIHWNYYTGMDILHPNLLRDEPYDIFYKLHGALAVQVIGESLEFAGAEPTLIRHLAYKAKFMIMPKNATIITFGVPVENVTWVVRGFARAEYNDEHGESIKFIVPNGQILSMTSVFLGRSSLRTYTAVTDIEVLFMSVQDFFLTIKRYSNEYTYFQKCKDEIGPMYDELYVDYVKKSRDYQRKQRERIFHERQSVVALTPTPSEKISMSQLRSKLKIPTYLREFRTNPEAPIILHWLTFRAAWCVISFSCTVLRDMISGTMAKFCGWVDDLGSFFVVADIIIKFFIPYYDHNGIVITQIWKCALHYGTRNFMADVVGYLLSMKFVMNLLSLGSGNINNFVQKAGEFLHVYLVTGLFDYYSNRPSSKAIFLLIVKWQIVLLMIICYATYFLSVFCMTPIMEDGEMVSRTYQQGNQCWMPEYHRLSERTSTRNLSELTEHEVTLIFVEGIRFTINGLFARTRSHFDYYAYEPIPIFHHITLAAFYWYQNRVCLSLLILYYRGHTVFQHGVRQLRMFLSSERVPKDVIEKSENHFIYCWKRTAGVNIKILMNERIGVVFRQDLNYYFYKRTFKAVDTLLRGGESLERMLASCTQEQYCLPGEDIMREMDLTPLVYILHRGKVLITQHDKKVITLTKGSIFGQLEGSTVRPSRVTARAVDHVDLLVMPLKKFQEAINDDVKDVIKRNTQSKLDYMAIKKSIEYNPYNTIEYILRGAKVIKFPRIMYKPISASENKWYARWLLLVWVINPLITCSLTLWEITAPSFDFGIVTWTLIAFDFLHIVHMITDSFSMELEVVDNECVYVYKRIKQLQRPWLYMDVISLIVPILSFILKEPQYHVARLLRIYSIFFFYKHFCTDFQSSLRTVCLKIACLLLLTHALTCGWILFFCRRTEDYDSETMNVVFPEGHVRTVNTAEWIYRSKRIEGCPRISPWFIDEVTKTRKYVQWTPVNWHFDYLIALCFVTQVLTRTNLEMAAPLNSSESCYEIFVLIVLYLVEMWFTSIVISSVYTMFREMYHFDYDVYTLVKFLRQNGVSKFLLNSIATYTRLLWERQKGKWLPAITDQAPLCLREDILSSLYMHHLLNASIFRHLPEYFLRQLVVRLKRMVIFPGKFIVKEGDIIPIIYFIHEGEVERWYTDKNGDARMSGLLAINGYFGLIPGLFPNTPYQFTYYTRTVVDIVYLEYETWQDLMDGYPELKIEVYSAAVKMRREGNKSTSKFMSQSRIMLSKNKLDTSHTNVE